MTFDDRLRAARDDYRSLDAAVGALAPPSRRAPRPSWGRGRAVAAVAAVAACVIVVLSVVVLRGDEGTTGVDTVAPPGTEATTGTSEAGGAGFPDCDDVASPVAPADRYRSTPTYVGNDQPRDEVRAWAETQPGYVAVWIDRDHNGWLTVAFTGDVDQRQADIDTRFPDAGVVAVEADWTVAELSSLQREITAALRPVGGSTGLLEHLGVVMADLGIRTPERMRALEPFADEPICVEGLDASYEVLPGPQPEGGDGWNLLGEGLTGRSYRTGVATTDAQYAALWAESGLTTERPTVDFAKEIVIWFGAVYGSSCPIRLDGVEVDRSAAVVWSRTVMPSNPGACTMDARSHAYVVTLERSQLPEGPFIVQLGPEAPPPGAPEERTVVSVDLSRPGSTATDDQIGLDPALMDATGSGGQAGS